ncbi:transcriptional regulator [Mycobacterium sp. IS-1742]|uniref:TetR/AcrR family transcriptional regulator n=1 Tax=Mycobacterium sp. IS-1742 TaxID=1772285 RepID=UPI00073FEC01|nr:TetR/AcrR family transcriptional regulator C-terminal domain-containing protein [Mycobacterium sp. IS-1742]KUI25140.1 transcriptional regulator [Mycobacterium sp. IS-1742]
MPRPRSLSSTQVAEAALALIDDEGLPSLSMRTVARRLGVGTMSLYRYVSDRAQLEELVVNQVLSGLDTGLPRGSAGRRLAVLAERVRSAAARHPAAVPLLLVHRHRVPASLDWGETVLGVLTDAGVTGRRRVLAFRAVLAYVFGALEVDHYGPLAGEGTRILAQLDEYPLLRQTATQAADVPPEEEFGRGFEILLRGLGL